MLARTRVPCLHLCPPSLVGQAVFVHVCACGVAWCRVVWFCVVRTPHAVTNRAFVEHYQVVKELGLVTSADVRSRNILYDILMAFQGKHLHTTAYSLPPVSALVLMVPPVLPPPFVLSLGMPCGRAARLARFPALVVQRNPTGTRQA